VLRTFFLVVPCRTYLAGQAYHRRMLVLEWMVGFVVLVGAVTAGLASV